MKIKNLTDEQIIKRVQKGKTEDFGEIVKRYSNKVFSIGMRFFYNTDDSADFSQEVFFKAFSNINSYRAIAPFRFWLVKLAYNLALNIKKSKKEEFSSIEEKDFLDRNLSPHESHIANELRETLLEEINKLPERYKVSLDMYFFWGLKYSEISEITGLPVNTIKSDVFRAKNILRSRLKNTLSEECYEL
ncbi:MAG TPA: sigma-70 family RNA polymerase sigma factor [Spirochaetota bacterium]|nr:sigma-70 family RNA polymerase sigma factor [Spirochaetota bacterium]